MAKRPTSRIRQSVKKASIVAGAGATATAMTICLSAPSANALTIPGVGDVPGLESIDLDQITSGLGAAEILDLANLDIADQLSELQLLGIPGLEDALGGLDLSQANLGPVLDSLGLALPDIIELLPIPSDLNGLPLPLSVTTVGPPFALLSLFGLNPLWAPSLPDVVADRLGGTDYLDLDLTIPIQVANPAYPPDGCSGILCPPQFIDASLPIDVGNIRLPVVIAFGLGSLATGMGYPQLEQDLANQPGGTGVGAEEGSSLTIVPMLLLRNPGRNDGGIAARGAPFFALFGIDTGTNDFDVQTDGTAILVPIKVDATVQNDPLSDFAAWPNPVTLANNAAAFAFPTYVLRGTDFTTALPQILEPLLGSTAGNLVSAVIGDGLTVDMPGLLPDIPLSRPAAIALLEGIIDPLVPGFSIPAEGFEALNAYVTLENGAQPVLEPFRYPTDFLSFISGQTITNPFADAVEPAITMLGNLGYTNVVQYGDDPNDFRDDYQRDFSDNFGSGDGEAVPFFTFPDNIDYGAVPADLFNALQGGVTESFFYGGIPGFNNPPPSYRNNPITVLENLIETIINATDGGGLPSLPGLPDLGGGLPDLGSLDDVLGGLGGATVSPLAANSVPNPSANRVAVSATADDDSDAPPAASSDDDSATATSTNSRPRTGIWRGSLNPGSSAADDSRGNPLSRAAQRTQQQLTDVVSSTVDGVGNTVGQVTKAFAGGGQAADSGDGGDAGDAGGE